MKKSKFTEAQIVFALKQSKQGVTVQEICRKMGVSEKTFSNLPNGRRITMTPTLYNKKASNKDARLWTALDSNQ